MIELTIGGLLNGDYEEPGNQYQLYVIRESKEGTVFYVGQSKAGVVNRVLQHLGKGQGFSGNTLITTLIHRVKPESLAWIVQLYRQDEILSESMAAIVKGVSKGEWESLLGPSFAWFAWQEEDGQDHIVYNNLDKAEQILIEELRPCLNVTYNLRGSRLPARYEKLLLY